MIKTPTKQAKNETKIIFTFSKNYCNFSGFHTSYYIERNSGQHNPADRREENDYDKRN